MSEGRGASWENGLMSCPPERVVPGDCSRCAMPLEGLRLCAAWDASCPVGLPSPEPGRRATVLPCENCGTTWDDCGPRCCTHCDHPESCACGEFDCEACIENGEVKA